MSYLLWHRDGATRIASGRRVLRAAELPLLADALALRERLETLCADEAQRLAAAAAAAHAEGFAQGLADGAREASGLLADRLVQLADAAAREREALRDQVGALALQVVRKMLGPFAEDELLVALADAACTETLPSPAVALVVHPDRADAVRARLAARPDPALRCELRTDPSLPPAGCRLETEHGSVDVALETQLARLAQAWGLAEPRSAS